MAMRLTLLKLRVLDLWMYHGRKDPPVFREEMKRGAELYRVVQESGAVRIVDIRTKPSFVEAFLAGALPFDGRLITVLTDGANVEAGDYVPFPLRKRCGVRLGLAGDALSDVPDGSADMVVLEGSVETWYDEAWRVLRPGGVVSIDGRTWTVQTKAERSGIR